MFFNLKPDKKTDLIKRFLEKEFYKTQKKEYAQAN